MASGDGDVVVVDGAPTRQVARSGLCSVQSCVGGVVLLSFWVATWTLVSTGQHRATRHSATQDMSFGDTERGEEGAVGAVGERCLSRADLHSFFSACHHFLSLLSHIGYAMLATIVCGTISFMPQRRAPPKSIVTSHRCGRATTPTEVERDSTWAN